MRETTQVARKTKNAAIALIGNSRCTVNTSGLRLPPRCKPSIRATGPKAIPAQMKSRIRSRAQDLRCPGFAPFTCFESRPLAGSSFSSLATGGPDSSGKGASYHEIKERQKYDSRTHSAPAPLRAESRRGITADAPFLARSLREKWESRNDGRTAQACPRIAQRGRAAL